MAPPAGGRAGKGGAKGKGGRGRAAQQAVATQYVAVPVPVPANQLPELIEESWAQCEKCQKWRKLPNGSEPLPEDEPWYCEMNPDKTKADCSIPEESYDEAKEVVVAASDPFYGASTVKKDMEEVKRELQQKMGIIVQPDIPMYAQASLPKQKKAGWETGGAGYGYSGSYGKQKQSQKKGTMSKAAGELQQIKALKQACERIVVGVLSKANAGSYDPPGLVHKFTATPPPDWVWQGLAKYFPDVVEEAAYAFDALSAARSVAGQDALLPSASQSGGGADPGSAVKQEGAGQQLAVVGQGQTAMDVSSPDASGSGGSSGSRADTITQLAKLAQFAMITLASVAMPKLAEEEQRLQAPAVGTSSQFAQQLQPQLLDSTPQVAIPSLLGTMGNGALGIPGSGLQQQLQGPGMTSAASTPAATLPLWPQQASGSAPLQPSQPQRQLVQSNQQPLAGQQPGNPAGVQSPSTVLPQLLALAGIQSQQPQAQNQLLAQIMQLQSQNPAGAQALFSQLQQANQAALAKRSSASPPPAALQAPAQLPVQQPGGMGLPQSLQQMQLQQPMATHRSQQMNMMQSPYPQQAQPPYAQQQLQMPYAQHTQQLQSPYPQQQPQQMQYMPAQQLPGQPAYFHPQQMQMGMPGQPGMLGSPMQPSMPAQNGAWPQGYPNHPRNPG